MADDLRRDGLDYESAASNDEPAIVTPQYRIARLGLWAAVLTFPLFTCFASGAVSMWLDGQPGGSFALVRSKLEVFVYLPSLLALIVNALLYVRFRFIKARPDVIRTCELAVAIGAVSLVIGYLIGNMGRYGA